jgi:hypothetical protein
MVVCASSFFESRGPIVKIVNKVKIPPGLFALGGFRAFEAAYFDSLIHTPTLGYSNSRM